MLLPLIVIVAILADVIAKMVDVIAIVCDSYHWQMLLARWLMELPTMGVWSLADVIAKVADGIATIITGHNICLVVTTSTTDKTTGTTPTWSL